MKIRDITLRDYKKFVAGETIYFLNSDNEINDSTLIIGNNGTGKSSLLQAIVALIAPLTRDHFSVSDIDWPGFEYRLIQSGRAPLLLEATVEFADDELDATHEYAEKLNELGGKLEMLPNHNQKVVVRLDYNKHLPIVGKGAGNYYQFSGYQYAKQLTKFEVAKMSLFDRVGNIYWYTEQRTSYSISQLSDTGINDIDAIRTFLSNAYTFHRDVEDGKIALRPGQFDFYDRLSKLYSTVFSDRQFFAPAPRFDFESPIPDFFLTDGHNQYELSEMSAGERAIFPILMDFARYNINNSIIIIDEVELHLHAPLQQTFVRALSKLGKNNQFILTTHSDDVAFMFDKSENIIRLE